MKYPELPVKAGTLKEAAAAIKRIAKRLARVHRKLSRGPSTDQRVVVLANLSARSAIEADRLAANLEKAATDQIAWRARNLFELNLRVRCVIKNTEFVSRLLIETVTDEIDMLKGLLLLNEAAPESDKEVIRKRIEFREQELKKQGTKPIPSMAVADLAIHAGVEKEYRVFYKLYSKYVHPSAHLIMSGRKSFELWDRRSKSILIMNAQFYAFDTLTEITKGTGLAH